jgi:hypothetical protein
MPMLKALAAAKAPGDMVAHWAADGKAYADHQMLCHCDHIAFA